MRIYQRFPEVSALGQAVGFELGFRQLDNGDPSIPATALFGKNVTLTNMRFSCGYHQLGLPPPRMLTFGVPVTGFRYWFGREYGTSHILPFNQSGGIDGVSGKGFEAFTISFSEEYLANIVSSYRSPVPKFLNRPTPESVIGRGKFNDRFRNLLNRIILAPDFELGQECEDELTITLLEAAQNDNANTDRSSPRLRTRAVERALAYIDDHKEEAITVRDLCSKNDIALRTLTRAFKERFGIGPKAYLKRQRLSAARTDILSSPPETQLTEIANQWGFWHMGQFANDYRNLFGELPSQTAGK